MAEYYEMKIAGLDRKLKKCAVNDKLDIAAFIMFGDVEITEKSAAELLKIAPEHVCDEVLAHMGKPGRNVLMEFKGMFDEINKKLGKDQFLTYYLIAAHPGCNEMHMKELSTFCRERLKTNPEQVQIFTPTPSSISTLMYYSRKDWSGKKNIKAEHSMQMKQRQKDIVLDPQKKARR